MKKKVNSTKKNQQEPIMIKIAGKVGELAGKIVNQKDQLVKKAGDAIDSIKTAVHDATANKKTAVKKVIKKDVKKVAKKVEKKVVKPVKKAVKKASSATNKLQKTAKKTVKKTVKKVVNKTKKAVLGKKK